MKTFVVNLDKNTDRMAFMDEQLRRFGIEYERVPAVYGAGLTKEERKKFFSAFRSFCASGRKLRPGEIGCSLSHCSIYERMIRENISNALVLEDDVVLDGKLNEAISKIISEMDVKKSQVFILSAHGVEEKKNPQIERIHGGMCTDGYVITLPAATIIHAANFPVITVADRWSRWEQRCGIEMYRVWPTSVQQDNSTFGTDISGEKICYGNGTRMIIHKIFRALECCLDVALYWATGR